MGWKKGLIFILGEVAIVHIALYPSVYALPVTAEFVLFFTEYNQVLDPITSAILAIILGHFMISIPLSLIWYKFLKNWGIKT